MKTTTEFKKTAAQPRQKTKNANSAMRQRPQLRKTEPSGFHRPSAKVPQNAQRNYEHYLALARAETLTGDRVTAENYFQHAEHYLRSMDETLN
ncbi:MAG: hypothetical protein JWQ17_2609 [Tardiphaga sp.]|nr:hypothetical protein [Tardiphaga sp.]